MYTVDKEDKKRALEYAEELLDEPGKWNRGCFAKNAEGVQVAWTSSKACSYCLTGALRKAALMVVRELDESSGYWQHLYDDIEALVVKVVDKSYHFLGLVAFNDCETSTIWLV